MLDFMKKSVITLKATVDIQTLFGDCIKMQIKKKLYFTEF